METRAPASTPCASQCSRASPHRAHPAPGHKKPRHRAAGPPKCACSRPRRATRLGSSAAWRDFHRKDRDAAIGDRLKSGVQPTGAPNAGPFPRMTQYSTTTQTLKECKGGTDDRHVNLRKTIDTSHGSSCKARTTQVFQDGCISEPTAAPP